MSKRKSNAWGHFTESPIPKKVKCIHCDRSISGGSTGNLLRHMKMKHPKVHKEIMSNETAQAVNDIPKENEQTVEEPVLTEEPVHAILEVECENSEVTRIQGQESPKPTNVIEEPVQQSMAYYLMEQIDVNRGKEIDKQLLKIIVKELHPFNVIENREFISFVSMLNPNYTLPSYKSLSNELLLQTYQSAEQVLKLSIKDATSAALTVDRWMSINNEGVIAVTAHYLDENLELKASLLDCISFQKNASINISIFFQGLVASWGLSNKIVAVVSENTPDIVEAVKECQWEHISCFAHTLNTIVRAGLTDINCILEKVRKTINYFKRDPDSLSKLNAIQSEMGLENSKLKRDTPLRWNSTFDMITRFLKNKASLLSADKLLEEDFLELSSGDWNILEYTIRLLVPFNTITVEICSEKNVPLSKVPYMVRFMIKHVTKTIEQQGVPTEVKKMGHTLKKELIRQYKELEANDVIGQSVLLDPRFKKRGFPEGSFEDAYSSLIKKVAALKAEKINAVNAHDAQSGLQGNSKQSEYFIDLWSDFRDEKPPVQNLTPDATVEIDAFLSELYLNMKDNPMVYWANKLNQKKFPTLFELVKSRLCVPATSVPSENIFSKAGNALTGKRNFITSGKLKEILFLHQNS